MSFFLYSIGPNLVVSPFPGRSRTPSHVLTGTRFSDFKIQRPYLRGSLGVTRYGLGQVPFPDPDNAELVIKDLFGRVEGFLYTVADSAVSNSLDTVDGAATTKQSSDWLSGIANAMEAVLKVCSSFDCCLMSRNFLTEKVLIFVCFSFFFLYVKCERDCFDTSYIEVS